MNACKSFMNWNWDVFFSKIAADYGFKTENALEFIRRGTDHHKTWTFLHTLLYAGVDELLQPYVDSVNNASVNGYWDWCRAKHEQGELSKNYVYMQQMITGSLMSIALYRLSVRRNNYEGKISFPCYDSERVSY